MKQKIYILGVIITMLIIIGAMLKINHWPGGGQLLILGVFSLIFVFLPLALRNHYATEGNRQHAVLYVVTWLTCLVVFGGMLMKVLHWNGAGIALMVALPFPYVIFLPVFLAVTAKDKNFDISNTVAVLFLLAGVSVFSALLALNVSKERIDDSMQLSRSYNRLEKVLDEIGHGSNQTPVAQKIDEAISIVDDYHALIFRNERITEEQWNSDPWSFRKPEYPDIASHALVIKGKNPTRDIRLQNGLKSLIDDSGKIAGYETFATAAPEIFSYKDNPEDPDGWSSGMFGSTPRIWSLIYLDGLETNLKMLRVCNMEH